MMGTTKMRGCDGDGDDDDDAAVQDAAPGVLHEETCRRILPATIAAARAAPLLAAVPRMGPTGRRKFVAARCVARCAGGGSVIQ